MDVICYEIEEGRVELQPSSHKRDWMDATPNGYAYRCVPLTVANGHGWDMLCPVTFAATWNGGSGIKDISITFPDANDKGPAQFVESHFGSGVLTFNPMLVLRTPPGYDLWVGGPVNQPKDGIAPLQAIVETDWMPFTFSMNWLFTRKKQWIRFQKGEPFASFFPVKRDPIESFQPKLMRATDAPEIHQQYVAARMTRNLNLMTGADDRERFQGWYAKGTLPSGQPAPTEGHRAKSRALPFSR